MKCLSVWTGYGNVGSIDEMRTTGEGKNILNFTMAINRKHKGEDATTWVRCVALGKTAEFVKEYLAKGSPVLVTGDLSLVSYKAKDGTEKQYLEVFTNNVVSTQKRENTAADGGGDF